MLAAIMITHNPNIDTFYHSIRSIIECVDSVYIFDNASLNIYEIRTLVNNYSNVTLLVSDENLGIAGLNVAANCAIKEGAKLISFFDQDSVLPDNFGKSVSSFFCKYNNAVCAPLHRDKNKLNMLCQRYIFTPFRIKKLTIDFDCNVNEFISSDFVIGSGMTISKDIWQRLSGFDERFFLDCADMDFCLRLKEKNIKIYLMTDCIMEHEIGLNREKVFGIFSISMHSPKRHYYYFLGVMMLLKKPYVPFSFKANYLLKILIQYVAYGFLIKNSSDHRIEINNAISQAFRGSKNT